MDELGLSNCGKGFTYSNDQRQRITKEIYELKAGEVSKFKTLNGLDVYRSPYNGWLDSYKAFNEATFSTTFYRAQEACNYC